LYTLIIFSIFNFFLKQADFLSAQLSSLSEYPKKISSKSNENWPFGGDLNILF